MWDLIIVYGPTASGKTSTAISLKEKYDIELINSDSRQIYKHLDIGTNKEKHRISESSTNTLQIDKIPIHLIDIKYPNESFSVGEYQKLAIDTIKDIQNRKKIPVLVGGSGLYISSIISKYTIPKVKPNKTLRKELALFTRKELQNLLKTLNSKKYNSLNNSDLNNPRRLIRAIEIEKTNPITTKIPKISAPKLDNIKYIQPEFELSNLFEKIDKRVIQMIEEGLVEETQKVVNLYGKSIAILNTMGYRESILYLEKKIGKDRLIQNIQTSHKQYVKKQITWFKKYIPNYPS